MNRCFCVLLSAFILSGCVLFFPEEKELLPVFPESAESQPQEFELNLDEFLGSGDPAALEHFFAEAPDSRQYEALRRLARELQQCRADLATEQLSESRFVADLEQKNRHLRETIEQLKSLLIQLEQRVH